MSQRFARIALRMPISRVRKVTLTSMMFITARGLPGRVGWNTASAAKLSWIHEDPDTAHNVMRTWKKKQTDEKRDDVIGVRIQCKHITNKGKGKRGQTKYSGMLKLYVAGELSILLNLLYLEFILFLSCCTWFTSTSDFIASAAQLTSGPVAAQSPQTLCPTKSAPVTVPTAVVRV